MTTPVITNTDEAKGIQWLKQSTSGAWIQRFDQCQTPQERLKYLLLVYTTIGSRVDNPVRPFLATCLMEHLANGRTLAMEIMHTGTQQEKQELIQLIKALPKDQQQRLLAEQRQYTGRNLIWRFLDWLRRLFKKPETIWSEALETQAFTSLALLTELHEIPEPHRTKLNDLLRTLDFYDTLQRNDANWQSILSIVLHLTRLEGATSTRLHRFLGASMNHTNVLRYAIQHCPNTIGPLLSIIARHQPESQKANLLTALLSSKDPNGWTVFISAIYRYPACIEPLLTLIASLQDKSIQSTLLTHLLNTNTPDGWTPLMIASAYHPTLVSPLLSSLDSLHDTTQKGILLNKLYSDRTKQGSHILMLSAQTSSTENLILFLKTLNQLPNKTLKIQIMKALLKPPTKGWIEQLATVSKDQPEIITLVLIGLAHTLEEAPLSTDVLTQLFKTDPDTCSTLISAIRHQPTAVIPIIESLTELPKGPTKDLLLIQLLRIPNEACPNVIHIAFKHEPAFLGIILGAIDAISDSAAKIALLHQLITTPPETSFVLTQQYPALMDSVFSQLASLQQSGGVVLLKKILAFTQNGFTLLMHAVNKFPNSTDIILNAILRIQDETDKTHLLASQLLTMNAFHRSVLMYAATDCQSTLPSMLRAIKNLKINDVKTTLLGALFKISTHNNESLQTVLSNCNALTTVYDIINSLDDTHWVNFEKELLRDALTHAYRSNDATQQSTAKRRIEEANKANTPMGFVFLKARGLFAANPNRGVLGELNQLVKTNQVA